MSQETFDSLTFVIIQRTWSNNINTDLPLDDVCSAVQEVRSVTLQTGVAHQVGGLENISIQPKVSFTR